MHLWSYSQHTRTSQGIRANIVGDFDLQKNWHWIAIAGGLILLFLLLGKRGGDSSSTSAPPTTVYTGGDPGIATTSIAARSAEIGGQQANQLAGFQGLLSYDATVQQMRSDETTRRMELTTESEIAGKQLANELSINTAMIGRDLKLGELAASVQRDAIMSQVQIAGINSSTQLGIAGIESQTQLGVEGIRAGTERERIGSNERVSFRGYDSVDLKTAADKAVSLEGIGSNERISLAGIDLEKYLGDLSFILGKKAIKADVRKTQIGADRDVSVADIYGRTQIGVAKANRKPWYESLFGNLGGILEGAAGLF